jgi:hypothetical protein
MQGIILLYPCNVECYSSTRYGERPTALVIGQVRLEVDKILNTWRIPAGVVFQVRTLNGQIFELKFDQHKSEWSFNAI